MVEPDTGRCWLAVVCAFTINFIINGFSYSIGVFYDEFLDVFGQSNGTTAWISSLNYGFLCFMGPIASWLIEKFGCRMTLAVGAIVSFISLVVSSFATDVYFLLVTLGICTGSGLGITYMGVTIVLSTFFSKYRAIALGIAATGSATGTFIFPLLQRYWLETYGWEGTLLLCAAFHLHVIAAALLIPSKPPLPIKGKDHPHGKGSWEFVKTKGFALLCANSFMYSLGLFVVYTHMASYARSLGQTKLFASFLLSLTGVAGLLGRIGISGILQLKLFSAPALFSLSFLIAGLGTMLSGFWTTKVGIIVTTCTFGFFSSACGPIAPEAACAVVGVRDLNKAFGVVLVFGSVGIILGPPIAGFIYDCTSFYPASFYFGGTCMVVSAIILSPVFLNCTRKKPTELIAEMVVTGPQICLEGFVFEAKKDVAQESNLSTDKCVCQDTEKEAIYESCGRQLTD